VISDRWAAPNDGNLRAKSGIRLATDGENRDGCRAVEVNRRELKEHEGKGMWLISLGFRLTHRVIV
jgi:hypothetical protein